MSRREDDGRMAVGKERYKRSAGTKVIPVIPEKPIYEYSTGRRVAGWQPGLGGWSLGGGANATQWCVLCRNDHALHRYSSVLHRCSRGGERRVRRRSEARKRRSEEATKPTSVTPMYNSACSHQYRSPSTHLLSTFSHTHGPLRLLSSPNITRLPLDDHLS
jgi:hypothetical protein